MNEASSVTSSTQPPDINSFRRRVEELREIHVNCGNATELSPGETEKLVNECALELESKINQILSDTSDIVSLASEDLDEFLEHLKKELSSVEHESAKIANEIEELSRRSIEDSSKLEGEFEGIDYSLNFIELQGLDKGNVQAPVECSANGEDQANLAITNGESKFKILELSHQIEKSRTTLKSLQDLDCDLKRFEVIEKIEDALSGLRVVDFDHNCIRLSLRTYIPNLESLSCQQKIEDVIEPLELNHELLIEVLDGTMEPKNVEIFPNDVYIGEIVDATKSFGQLYTSVPVLESKSPLEWLVQKVQDRIVHCTIRSFVVKCANKSRHSFEYVDREEMIVAHMVGEIDAFIKVSQGWPMSNSALNLTSLKSSSHNSKEISLSFLCKVKEMANSLGAHIRQNISSFVEGIEDILVRQMSSKLQQDSTKK